MQMYKNNNAAIVNNSRFLKTLFLFFHSYIYVSLFGNKFYLSVFIIPNSAATSKMMHVEDGFSRLRKSLLRLRSDRKLLHNCHKRKMFVAYSSRCCRFLSFPFYITAFASETGIPIRFGIFIKILFHYRVTGIKKGTAK